ncbi:MAG TPA: aspartyl protease family protein [Phycisphaerae bacterium]|nr:aspartyl protease family protein [Phycisphaerae bacterium]
MNICLACTALFFLVAAQQPENPWKARVPAAVATAQQENTTEAYCRALDTAWRADDWQMGLALARESLEKWPESSELRGRQGRTFWRAGHIAPAEELAARISPDTTDHVALRLLVQINAARGNLPAAATAAERLAELPPLTAEDLFAVLGARLAQNRLAGLPEMIRRIEQLAAVANGYPENYMVEQLGGLAEFFEAVGSAPLNQIARFGEAVMPVMPLINLPGCQVMINGRGPYRMLVDTGGSITLSLDQAVAAELGLKSIADATIHGIGGREQSGQTLVEELTIGEIRCKRVMTRTFELRKSIAYAADGVLGTGIFADSRMTLDFEHGRLHVAAASDAPGPGREAQLRIVGDGKLLTPTLVNGTPLVGLLDSGADVFALSPALLEKLFPERPIKSISAFTMGVGSDAQPSISMMPTVTLEVAGRKFADHGGVGLDVLDTLLSPMLGIQTDALVGMPVLRDMRTLTVDFAHSKMWVEWLAGSDGEKGLAE